MASWNTLLTDSALLARLPLSSDANVSHGSTSGDGSLVGSPTFSSNRLVLNGTTQYLDLSAIATNLGTNATICLKIQIDLDPPFVETSGFGHFGDGVSVTSHYPYNDGIIYMCPFRASSAGSTSRVTVGNPSPSLQTAERSICIRTQPGANGWQFLLDGSVLTSATGINTPYYGGSWWLGRSFNGTNNYYIDGRVRELWIFSKRLTDEEEAEIRGNLGAEPVYLLTNTSLATNGAFDVGDVDDPSNGTVTHITKAIDEDGNEIDSKTTTTGTFNLSAVNPGKRVYLFGRASNTGSYDIGDYSTRDVIWGTNGDGFYQLAYIDFPNQGITEPIQATNLLVIPQLGASQTDKVTSIITKSSNKNSYSKPSSEQKSIDELNDRMLYRFGRHRKSK